MQEKSVPSFGAVGILVSVEPHDPVHVATVNPVVVLTGNLTSRPITVGPLMGTAPDCSGGPYLEAGAKVLLSLRKDTRYSEIAEYQVGTFGDTILFNDREAFFMHAGRGNLELAGTSENVIEPVPNLARTTPATRDQARRFLGLGPPASGVRPPDTGNGGLIASEWRSDLPFV
jgi:hypothetical protein